MSLDVYLYDKEFNKELDSREEEYREVLYSANITHNLNEMAEAAGIYGIVWQPNENGIKKARQLIEPLKTAIDDMRKRPKYYEKYSSPNGWGMYENFVPWLERYLSACEQYPDSFVESWR